MKKKKKKTGLKTTIKSNHALHATLERITTTVKKRKRQTTALLLT